MRDPGRASDDQLAAALGSTDDGARDGSSPDGDGPGAVGPARPPSGPYEGWTVAALRERAAEAGIVGRSRMRKDQLARALHGAMTRDRTDRSG